MKLGKPKKSDILVFALILLLIIPQTRKPIQVGLNKILSQFGPSVIDVSKRNVLEYDSFKLEDLSGNQVNLKDYTGEVILLNFWATWCAPCIAELPQIQALANDYNDKIKIVLVSGESTRKVSSFLNSKAYTLNSYKPLERYPEQLNVSSIPRTFLIDKNGEILIDKTGAANWNSAKVRNLIDELLK